MVSAWDVSRKTLSLGSATSNYRFVLTCQFEENTLPWQWEELGLKKAETMF